MALLKKIKTVNVATGLLLIFSTLFVSAEQSSEKPSYRVLIPAFPVNLPPYRWFDQCTNTYKGSIPLLLNKAAEDLGVNIELSYIDRYSPELMTAIWERLRAGDYDALVYLFSGDGLPDEFVRSDHPFAIYRTAAIVNRRHAVNIFTEENMKNMQAVMMLPVQNLDAVNRIKSLGKTYIPSKSTAASFDLIADDVNSYTFLNEFFARIQLYKNSEYRKNLKVVELQGLSLDGYNFLYRMKSSDSQFFDQLDEKINYLYTSGYWKFISRQYLTLWLRNEGCVNSVLNYKSLKVKRIKVDDFLQSANK